MNGGREPGSEAHQPIFTKSQPSPSSGENEQHWPEQRPMTPADFDRPFTDEPVGHKRAEVRPSPERSSEPAAEPTPAHGPDTSATPAPGNESDDKSAGERKRGWWKRVLS